MKKFVLLFLVACVLVPTFIFSQKIIFNEERVEIDSIPNTFYTVYFEEEEFEVYEKYFKKNTSTIELTLFIYNKVDKTLEILKSSNKYKKLPDKIIDFHSRNFSDMFLSSVELNPTLEEKKGFMDLRIHLVSYLMNKKSEVVANRN